nr:hypothetical protein GCM10025699_17420 [Microbacterium flavescens]
MLGDEEIDEDVHPRMQGMGGAGAFAQEHGTGLRCGIDLVAIDRDDEIGASGEVPVERPDADAGAFCDHPDGSVDSRLDEYIGRRVDDLPLIAHRVAALPAGGNVVGHEEAS